MTEVLYGKKREVSSIAFNRMKYTKNSLDKILIKALLLQGNKGIGSSQQFILRFINES